MQFSFSDEKIEELRRLVEVEFGEPVSHDEARVIANNLLRLVEIVTHDGRPDGGSAA